MFNPGFGFTGNQGHIHGLTFRGGTDAFHHRPPNQAEELSLYGFNRLHQNGSSCTLAFFFFRAPGLRVQADKHQVGRHGFPSGCHSGPE
ncbi:Uncharacterised protein [Escherichia coli]|nr:Uncharacterised protein [Escherichia coli]